MKLSERTGLTTESRSTDTVHIVRDLASYKMAASVLFNNPHLPIRSTVSDTEIIIFRKDKEGGVGRIAQDGDILIFISRTDKLMIMGMAIGVCDTYPSDLRDSTKFLNFIETTAAL